MRTDGVEPDLLIRHADQAMYLAKQAGKNRYHLFDVAHDTAIQTQREEIARLRGQIETLNYELETAKKRQQDFYVDLDARLRKFEAPAAGSAAVDGANPPNSAPTGDPAKEGQEYEAALNQFKASKYKEAATGFAAFVQKYPDTTVARLAQGRLRALQTENRH